ETVAYGAALQAAALTAGASDPGKFYSLLLDVAPRALGIAVVGGYSETIVPRNTPVPVERVRSFSTSRAGQTEVHLLGRQGEARRFDDNEPLGVLMLSGLPARPRGESSIEVTFTIDSDGILSVRARDVATSQETKAVMQVFGAPAETGEGAAGDP